jgi:hypothetical protein
MTDRHGDDRSLFEEYEPEAKADLREVMFAICRESLADAVGRFKERQAEVDAARYRHPAGGSDR